MVAGPLTTTFFKDLISSNMRDDLSNVIDEIERETYWETRNDILNSIRREIERGNPKELVDYMLNKPKPGV